MRRPLFHSKLSMRLQWKYPRQSAPAAIALPDQRDVVRQVGDPLRVVQRVAAR